jgi:hypothetical protein
MTRPGRGQPGASGPGGQDPRPGGQDPRPGGQRPRPSGQRPRPSGQDPRPGGQDPRASGQQLYTPGASGTRQAVERSSARPLLYLRQLPRWLPPLVMLALLIAGFAVPGAIGAAALVLVAAFLAWLGYLSWPSLAARGRLLRIVAIAFLLALAAVQATR